MQSKYSSQLYNNQTIDLRRFLLFQVLMQRIGFALPLMLVVPVTVSFLTDACHIRSDDPCFMANMVTKELFWKCNASTGPAWTWEFLAKPQTYIWLGWLVSQFWVCIHLWTPRHERLAKSEK